MQRPIRTALQALFLAALSAPSLAGDPPPTELVSEASAPDPACFRQVAAERLGLDASDILLGRVEGPVRLHDAGLVLFVASAADPEGQHKVVIALDAEGRCFDLEAARAADRSLARTRRGKLSRALHEQMTSHPEGERLDVVAWIPAPDLFALRDARIELIDGLAAEGRLTAELCEFHQRELAREVLERIRPLTTDAAERLEALGLEVSGWAEDAPMVYLRADAAELAGIQESPLVDSLDWAGELYTPRQDVAFQTIGANFSHFPSPPYAPIKGYGAKVAIVEGPAPCKTNPWLQVAASRVPFNGESAHTTGVASCVKSKLATVPGIAPEATLIAADGAVSLASTQGAISWVVTQGAQVLNLSMGATYPSSTVGTLDRYLDFVARNNCKTVVSAVSNSGTYSQPYVGTPGSGYNQIAVGYFDDRNTSNESDDSIAPKSGWLNPSSGVDSPQLVAPGHNITMLSHSYLQTASGTSFAAGLVSGTAALTISGRPELGMKPEGVRALLMASAWHNLESSPTLSSMDGAGGVEAGFATDALKHWKYGDVFTGVLTKSSFDASGMYTVGKFSAIQTNLSKPDYRVCLAFNSTPTADYSQNPLLADLDLFVYDPNGNLVAWSLSSLNPFEVVQFTVGSFGEHTVKIKKYGFAGSSERFGVGVSRR